MKFRPAGSPVGLRRRRRYSLSSPGGRLLVAGCCLIASAIFYLFRYQSARHISDVRDEQQQPVIIDDDDDDDYEEQPISTWTPPPNEVKKPPKLAMLLSFPNSGTSYTLKLVKTATGYFTGNTYIKELYQKRDPIYPDTEKGPYWQDETQAVRQTMRRPPEYVLVKSHCAGYCSTCSPVEQQTSEKAFRNGCVKTFDLKDQVARFDIDKVSKIVHMVRNPFDNIVARYHLDMHLRQKYNETSEYDTNTPEGFVQSCAAFVDSWWNEDGRSEGLQLLPDKVQEAFEIWQAAKVPCFSDFYRYAIWHNHAFELRTQLELPQLILHYDSWGTDWESSKWKLLTFLEYSNNIVKDPLLQTIPFISSGKSYSNYYTDEQRSAIQKGLKLIASRETWEILQDYF